MSMFWNSQTGHFQQEEIDRIQGTPTDEVAEMIVNSAPLVALRVLAEMMLNGADGVVALLMMRPEVDAHWLTYGDDPNVDSQDHGYAQQLRERFGS